MRFEWDSAKAERNLRKHGVSFAKPLLFSPTLWRTLLPIRIIRSMNIAGLTFRRSQNQRLLVISHGERDGRLRIISARRATRHERKIYEEI